jgi:c-di-GMP-binding flagellar brake protein YcgR
MALQQERRDSERASRIRPCTYELSMFSDRATVEILEGRALTINISRGGMLLLLPQVVAERQVFEITAPSLADEEHTTKVVEVCWTRPLPVSAQITMHLAGVRFLFEPSTSFN